LLTENGLRLVERNFRCRGGEIDLVMLHAGSLVFVEVRYRSCARFSAPELTVNHRKQRKIIRTAAVFLSRHRRFARHIVRFDVVAIVGAGARDDAADAIWLRDAFRPKDSTL
jgi:putative endonuclease